VVSDEEKSLRVRKVTTEMHEVDGSHGRRILVNGQKIFCRGGYIQPELMFDWDARRIDNEIRYFAEENTNLIYFEDIRTRRTCFSMPATGAACCSATVLWVLLALSRSGLSTIPWGKAYLPCTAQSSRRL